MAETTVAGLPIEIPGDLRTPLGAVIVVKGLDADDEIAYYICKMLVTASDELRLTLADVARDPGAG